MFQSLRLHDKQVLFFIGVALLLLALVNFLLHLPQIKDFIVYPHFRFETSFFKTQSSDTSRRTNMVLFSVSDANEVTNVVVTTYNPENQEVYFIKLDPKTTVNLAYGRGLNSLANAFQEKNIDILLQTISDTFAIPIDGYFQLAQTDFSKENLLGLKKNITGVGNFWKIIHFGEFGKKVKTNYNALSLFSIYREIWSIRADKFYYKELSQAYYLPEDQNGVTLTFFNKEQIDSLIDKLFNDPSIEKEAAKVEIKNGTGKSGLATRSSRLISNIGVEVVAIDNAELDNIQKTIIINYNQKNYTAGRIAYA